MRQRQPDVLRAGSLTDHNIQLVIFHGRIKDLFHRLRQTVNFVNKQHFPLRQRAEDRRQIPLPHNGRSGSNTHIHMQLIGDDIGQGGFPQPRRAEQQHMIQRFFPGQGRANKHRDILFDLVLSDIFF